MPGWGGKLRCHARGMANNALLAEAIYGVSRETPTRG